MNWIKSLILIFVSIIFGVVFLELGIRKLYPETLLYNRFQEPVKYGEFTTRRLKPNSKFKHVSKDKIYYYKTNSMGFRMEKEVSDIKDPGNLRVLILGDSHTQGFEVQQNETFSELLNKKNCQKKKLEVINTGISGTGTSEHLITLLYLMDKLKPDIIIEAFYPNDLINNNRAFHKIENDLLKIERYNHPASNWLKILKIHNNFFLTRYLSQNSFAYSLLMNSIWEKAVVLLYGRELLLSDALVELNPEQVSRSDIKLLNSIISEMKRVVDKKGKFFIITIPTIESYQPEDFFNKENLKNIINIKFDKSKKWHVQNGLRHINNKAHAVISKKIYEFLCVN